MGLNRGMKTVLTTLLAICVCLVIGCGEKTMDFESLKALAEKEDAKAQTNLGLMYDNGQGVGQDFKEAAKWYQKAADQGDADAQYNLGLMYDNGEGVKQNKKEAVNWYRKAAVQGLAGAQWWLGTMYRDGEGVVQDRVMTIILLCYQGQIRVNPCRRNSSWRSRTCSHTS